MTDAHERETRHHSRAGFATTRWTLVAAAASDDPTAAPALSELCSTYWPPIYAFLRRRGLSVEEAQDVTQGFVIEIIERGLLHKADADRGSFRSFLLGACKYFLSHRREHDNAAKRGGKSRTISFDFERGEEWYRNEPRDEMTPERLFERRWALTLLESVLDRLRAEYEEAGKTKQFVALEPFITAGDPNVPYADVAVELGWNPNATKVAVHRLRRRYRELLRAEVADTIDGERSPDAELECLIDALRSD